MASILETIVEHKRNEVRQRQEARPLAALEESIGAQGPPRGFAANLSAVAAQRPAIIAEVKRGSPSLGCIRPDLEAAKQAAAYEAGGAAAISVLTDAKFFFGGDDDLLAARASVALPVLRKEFIVDPYQVAESRALGADCILLIMAILDDGGAAQLAAAAHELGMDVLVEVFDEEELERAVAHVEYDMLGINNRNLKTFVTNVERSIELAASAPAGAAVVAESGVRDAAAVQTLYDAGVKRFLVGEAFVTSADPRATVAAFSQMSED